jgi:filamentous hemagglutinin family protein
MRALGWIVAASVLLGSAGGAQAQELNKPPKGFTALFNGKDLTNWKGLIDIKRRASLSADALPEAQRLADEKMKAHWSVENGIILFDGKGDSLQTVKDYGNFEMYVDWKIPPMGDSGIYVRGNPQIQIWDNPIGSGGLFNNQKNPSKPVVVADKPVGEWNTFYIKMVGDRVTVKLNDKLVVDDTPMENYWFRGQPLPSRGPIELQNHNNPLQFRNIYVRELPDTSHAAPEPVKLVSLTVTKASLSQIISLLTANGGADIIVRDPKGIYLDRQMEFLSIRQKPLSVALEIVSRAAGMLVSVEKDGTYLLYPKNER